MNHNGTGLNQACRALFVNLRFHVSEINTSDWNLLDHRIDTCLTLEDVANGFLKCLKHFIFPNLYRHEHRAQSQDAVTVHTKVINLFSVLNGI